MSSVSAMLAPEQDVEGSFGVFLNDRTVICQDCGFIGVPHIDVCRKCASASIVGLMPIVAGAGVCDAVL